jgi:16S rRNA (uracil1498-N3)-methyltransferase
MIKVIKLEIGETIELCDGKGKNAFGKIKEMKNKKVIVEIEKLNEIKINENKTTLFCSILKKENFELVVQKATECGISTIVPIISDRTIKTGLNMERLQKIAKEASEQSGRSTVPKIIEPISFDESLKLVEKKDLNPVRDREGSQRASISNGINVLFDASGESLFKKDESLSLNINIWIGPEGGWTNEEIKKAQNLDFKIASLGKLILRGETAAIIASYLISN